MSEKSYKNFILKLLPPEVIDRLRLVRVELPLDREIEFPGKRIANVFFPEEGVASMTATFQDGFQVEIALAGREAILGSSSMFGTRRSLGSARRWLIPWVEVGQTQAQLDDTIRQTVLTIRQAFNRVYMQISGHGYASEMATAIREFKRCGQFHDLVLRYVQAQFIQSCQTAGCNARHTVEQRMARWLLLCADRVGDRVLPLSHEYLADMLGVTRSSVTLIAGTLQERNLIQYSRARIQLLDLPGLELLACECYRVVLNHLASLSDMDSSYGS